MSGTRTHERIYHTMTAVELIDAMSDGLPGAVAVATRIYAEGGDVDPGNPLKGLGPILSLDSLGIYGARLWRFYKDVCREDVRVVVTVLRAWGVGIVDAETINAAIAAGTALDLAEISRRVKERWPDFQTAE